MRTYTREQVEQVVETMLRNVSTHETPAGAGYRTAVREVLRRLDALPNPPAAPESSPTRSIAQGIADMTRHLPILPGVVPCDVKLAPRPRATTPTPEVPALKDEPHYRCADPDCEAPERPECGHVLTGRPPGSLRATCRKAPHGDDVPHRWDEEPGTVSPEPTAPEVVWEGDGVRVLADGTCEEEWPAPRGWAVVTDDRAMVSLARALAEARRETGILKAAAEGQLKTTNAVERANAELAWGVAGSMQSALRRERSLRQEAEREQCIAHVKADASYAKGREDGAEAMRERAKALIMAEQAKQEDGPLSDDNGHAFRLLLRLADAVSALSLEAGGEVPSTVDADLAAKALTEAVHNAVGMVADECLGMLHRGRVADAIATLTASKQVTP